MTHQPRREEKTTGSGHNNAQGRPAGHMLRWCHVADEYPDRKSHQEASYKKSADKDGRFDRRFRKEARDWALFTAENNVDLFTFLQDVEREPGDSESDEPQEVP